MGVKEHFKTTVLLLHSFGFRIRYVGLFFFRIFISFSISCTMILDELFFFRTPEIKSPVFLIGHLRSGTTFLHRYMGEMFRELATLKMWDMLFPSRIMRFFFFPFKPLIRRISLDSMYDPKIHKTGLFALETDDIALSFRFSGGLLTWLYFKVWDNFESRRDFRRQMKEMSAHKQYLDYMEKLYAKKLPKSGRFFSKSFTFLFNIDQILRKYPDARIVMLIRDPLQTIPSTFSLELEIQKHLNNLDEYSEIKKEYYINRLYETSLIYYRTFHSVVCKYHEKLHVLTHRRMKEDFNGTMKEICDFCSLELTKQHKEKIFTQHMKQKEFKSEHSYNIKDFGFSEEKIRKDFSFIYENYDV